MFAHARFWVINDDCLDLIDFHDDVGEVHVCHKVTNFYEVFFF